MKGFAETKNPIRRDLTSDPWIDARSRSEATVRTQTSPGKGRWREVVVAVGAALALIGLTVSRVEAQVFHPLEPVAIVSATPSVGAAPLIVAFDGRSSTGPNPLVSWTWSFGDGSTGSGDQATHVYSAPGSYAASLVVTDNLGLFSFPRTVIIVVSAPTLPDAPANLTAMALSKSSIRLNWTPGQIGQTEFRIERSKGSGTTFTQVGTVAATAVTFTDTGLSSRTLYTYRVRAHNAVGDSAYSNLASARTLK